MKIWFLLFSLFYFTDVTDSRRVVSSKLALGVCNQRQKFEKTGVIQKPAKKRSDIPGKISCGWFKLGKCSKQAEECPPPFLVRCSQILNPRKKEVINIRNYGMRNSKRNSSKGGRIVGGKEAKKHEFPSLVSINMGHSWKQPNCGGTIIHAEWVLTAAHCLISEDEEYYEVVAGEHAQSIPEESEQHVHVASVIVHDEYDYETYTNDIGLLKVTPPFKFNDVVNPAILPFRDYKPEGAFQITGWGRTKEDGPVSDLLQKLILPFIDHKECQEKLPEQVILDSMMCAGLDGGSHDACQGDSGGPLYTLNQTEEGRNEVVGIVSWGLGCARPHSPGIYTQLTSYLNWLSEFVPHEILPLRKGEPAWPTKLHISYNDSQMKNKLKKRKWRTGDKLNVTNDEEQNIQVLFE